MFSIRSRFILSISFALSAFFCVFTGAALAQERINNFDVTIEVEASGDIIVTEEITVTAQGNKIRRGIFRDLPRYFDDDRMRLPFEYDILEVLRDEQPETYQTSSEGNAYRIRIGRADYFLPNGQYTYLIEYRVANQIRYRDDADELYWNATGTYWDFPIETASATVFLPAGAQVLEQSAYTGAFGSTAQNYRYRADGNAHTFEVTGALARREGLSISLDLAKGVIEPPTREEQINRWWQRNGALAILIASTIGLFGLFNAQFNKVGRDPAKGPVFPRYEPPGGYSPAAVHHIWYRAISGHNALIATLLHAGIRGVVKLDALSDKKTNVTLQQSDSENWELAEESKAFLKSLFAARSTFSLGSKYDPTFTSAYTEFAKQVATRYGKDYFRWNILHILLAVGLSLGVVLVALIFVATWTIWHTLAVLALAALNIWFMYVIPAPTRKGQDIRTEIEGFRLYLETAEQLQLNSAQVGSDAPPAMTKERYERFLPYAVALDLEKPWTEHFEKLIPQEAENYAPHWGSFHNSGGRQSLTSMNKALVAGLSSGVTASMPQSSSSSGSGGGGFSGGGGGGGGGGGW
ncbi:MAG: DUF2207 domain-containing protein [Aquisalinus sp.]|nr:DUF2207 domain-containing protein [Aquisalinus sp.]